MYLLLTLVVDTGVLPALQHSARNKLRKLRARLRGRRGGGSHYQQLLGGEAVAGGGAAGLNDGGGVDDAEWGGARPGEDEDVAAERRLVQSGEFLLYLQTTGQEHCLL